MAQTQLAGILLCGGLSSRMGQPKHLLPLGPRTLLEHTLAALAQTCEPVVLVAAAGQTLPALGEQVRIVRDETPQQGPLEGIRAGLAALPLEAELALVAPCDAPLLTAAVIRQFVEWVGDLQGVAVWDEGYWHPLPGLFRRSILPVVTARLARGERSLQGLLDGLAMRRVSRADLATVDPDLGILRNLNDPASYSALCQEFQARSGDGR